MSPQYGQTIVKFELPSSVELDRELHMAELVQFWVSSGSGLDPALLASFAPDTDNPNLQHFTQLAWAHTTKIGEFSVGAGKLIILLCPGCGWSHYRSPTDPDASVSEVVCNWVAAGNKEGEAVYSQGAACSDCGPGYGCGEDGALCVLTTTATSESEGAVFESPNFPNNYPDNANKVYHFLLLVNYTQL